MPFSLWWFFTDKTVTDQPMKENSQFGKYEILIKKEKLYQTKSKTILTVTFTQILANTKKK